MTGIGDRSESVNLRVCFLIEQGLTSPPTQLRDGFKGQRIQPTVSKYWRNKKYTKKRTHKTQQIP